MRIYVASSWRNPHQQTVVRALRARGHAVYDFRNPEPGNHGFAWSTIDPDWARWSSQQYVASLKHPIAESGFALDMQALRDADACVYVLPCGRSASLEAGYAIGAGKPTCALILGEQEPELMLKMVHHIAISVDEVLMWAANTALFTETHV